MTPALRLVRRNGRFDYETGSPSTPAATEVVLRMICAGLCGTDRDIAVGARDDRACVLGHEGMAEVIATGSDVEGLNLHDRVCFNPVSPVNQDDILGHSYDGVFQTHVIVDTARHPHLLCPCPASFPPGLAPLIEIMGVVLHAHAIWEERFLAGPVLILGTGAFAHLLAAYYNRLGMGVTLVTSNVGRARALRRITTAGTDYRCPGELSPQPGFGMVHLCVPRRQAAQALGLALEQVRTLGAINAVSGFALSADTDLSDIVSTLCAIRRANACGLNRVIVPLCWRSRPLLVSGHRGADLTHMHQAISELACNGPCYQQLVQTELPFTNLAALLNSSEYLSLDHRGKLVVTF